MAIPATTAAIAGAANVSNSCRVKSQREQFLELVEMAKPGIVYRSGRSHLFSHDGFVIYAFECEDGDFKSKALHAIEF